MRKTRTVNGPMDTNDMAILVVEDNLPDYQTVLRAFRKVGVNSPVYHCETGEEALDFVYRRNAYQNEASSPRPSLILLDLNLPGTDGRDVLKQLKNDADLRAIPIVVFTTSNSEIDIAESYKSGANSYITKPVNIERLYEVMEKFRDYWFNTATIPDTVQQI